MKKIFISILAMLTIVIALFAHSGSSGFSSTQVKLVRLDDKFYLFLSDANSAPMSNKNVTASAKSDAPELLHPEINIAPFSDNCFVVNKEPGNFKFLKVTLHDNVSNQNLILIFANTHEEQSGYLCPLHPDKVFNGEGKCAKCGAPLVPKRFSVYSAPTMGKELTRKEKFAFQ